MHKPLIPQPFPDHGWISNNESSKLEPLWFEGDTIPQQLLDILASNIGPDGDMENDQPDEDLDVYAQSDIEESSDENDE